MSVSPTRDPRSPIPDTRAAPPLRVILAGVGTRGRHWARVLLADPRVQLVAAVDPNPAALVWLRDGADTGGAFSGEGFAEIEAALRAVAADVLVLATPPVDRLRHCRLAFERGLRVMAEKPLTCDLAEAEALVRAAPSERHLQVSMNFRYIPVHQEYHRLIKAGAIGQPAMSRYVYWRNRDGRRPGINKYPLTMDQPMLLEQSIHHFDTMRYVYDSEITHVTARTHNPPWSMYRDDATVLSTFDFANGVLLEYIGTWASRTPLHEHYWRTDGDRGALYQREQWTNLHLITGPEPTDTLVDTTVPLPEWRGLYDDAYVLWQAYVDELLGPAATPSDHRPAGRTIDTGPARQFQPVVLPVPSGRDHLVPLAVAFACHESSLTGRRIALPEFIEQRGLADLIGDYYKGS